MSTEEPLPQSQEAERSVLGAILLAPAAICGVMPILDEGDFYDLRHGRVFGAATALSQRKVAIDLLTVKEELSRNGGIEKAGGSVYLSGLVDGVPDIGNVEHYARIVKEKSVLRRLIRAGQKITQGALSQEKDLGTLLADAAAEILAVKQAAQRGASASAGAVNPEAPAPDGYAPRCYSLQELSDKPPAPVEWRVEGLIQGDGITGVIGRPKIGKTIFLEQLALCVAGGVDFLGRKTAPGRVLYIDEEMAKPVVFARWLRMRAAHLSFDAPETLARYFIVSLGGLSIDKPDQIRAEIEKAQPDLLIVDSFRRVFRGQENDSAEVAKGMAFFAAVRSEYEIDVVLSHHTRKNLEGSEFWEDAARGSSDFFAACDGLIGLGKRGKGLIEMRATLRAAAEPDPVSLALDEEKLVWDMTSRQPDSSSFDSFKAIEEILLSKPGYRWPQKLVAQALQTDFHRTDKQAEKALSKLSTFKDDAPPPLETRIFKRPLPGTKNEREVILAVTP